MTSYPVFFGVTRPDKFDRVQLAMRVVILAVLSFVGLTMGALFVLLYVMLPVIAAIALSRKSPARFLTEDAPRIARGLRWVMSAYAYIALLTDRPPMEPDDRVRFAIEPGAWSAQAGGPSVTTALLRLIYSIPSALLLCVLAFVSWIVWLVAALMILLTEDYPAGLYDFQCGVLRWQARLFGYQASLAEPYPPFTFDAGAVVDIDREPLPH